MAEENTQLQKRWDHIRRPLLNKSDNMQSILIGSPETNHKYFIDSLERFEKDFAIHNKHQMKQDREKKGRMIEKKQQHMQQLHQKFQQSNSENHFKQHILQNYSQQLYDMGLKKSGMTNGIPVNPVNNQYLNTYNAQEFQKFQNQKKLNNMLRLHHLQKKGTCGYNVINGKENTNVHQLIPQEQINGMNSRIQEYNQRYTLRAPYN